MGIKLCEFGMLTLAACGGSNNNGASPDAPPDTTMDPPPLITIRLDPPGDPPLVAFQDGDGPWQVASGSNGVYYARAENQRYAVAVACTAATSLYGGPYVRESYQTLAAGSTVNVVGCTSIAPAHSNVTIELPGAPSGTYFTYGHIGDAIGSGTGNAPIVVSAAHGKSDVLVSSTLGTGDELVFRGQTLDVQGDQTISVDLTTAGHHLESHAANVTGFVAGHRNAIVSRYATPYSHGLWPLDSPPVASDGIYRTIEASGRQPGDIIEVEAYDFHQVGDNDVGDRRSMRVAVTDAVDISLAIPDDWAPPVPTVVDAATAQTRITLPVAPATLDRLDYTITFRSNTPSEERSSLLEAYVTAEWLGGSPGSSPTITTPDLSQLPGWLPEMGLQPDAQLNWFLYRAERNMPAGTPPVDGRRIIANLRSGEMNPP